MNYDTDETEFENEFENENIPEYLLNSDEDDDEDDDTSSESDNEFDDDDFQYESKPKKTTTKRPQLIGKHTLQQDSIFKTKINKKEDEDDEYESEHFIKNAGGSFDIDYDNIDFEESKSNIDYYIDVRLTKKTAELLKLYTDIDFEVKQGQIIKRRIPSKSDFNAYYNMLIKELHIYGYNKYQIFLELAGYFSDNYWNVFKVLDKNYQDIIIKELKDITGWQPNLDIF